MTTTMSNLKLDALEKASETIVLELITQRDRTIDVVLSMVNAS